MQFITDFHIHSKYSRATSKEMDLEHIDLWCQKKGIEVVTCADFTHPIWYKELKEKLEYEDGVYYLKNSNRQTKFILTTEISLIYKKGDKTRRIHLVVGAPDLETVGKINEELGKKYNLKSDGRPILGLDAEKLVELLMKINSRIMVIPAHIWTPWFALFGSKSGFDTFEECFGQQTKNIFAIETGLSSDPKMNWMISQIDDKTIVSNSDAHSPDNLGREANVFEGKEINYELIYDALKNKGISKNLELKYTIEFFPEEGKYHFDGHADCGIVMHPSEAKKNKNICPKCKRPLVLGVDHRVLELADRDDLGPFANRIPFKSIVPLRELIAGVLELGKKTKGVDQMYEKLIKLGGNEFHLLLEQNLDELKGEADEDILNAIELMRKGRVKIEPGYDGIYGKIGVDLEPKSKKQKQLF